MTVSFNFPPMVTSSLLSTFGGIYNPITSNLFNHNIVENCSISYLPMRVLAIQIVLVSMLFKDKFGLHYHNHLARNMPSGKNKYLKNHIIVYYKHRY